MLVCSVCIDLDVIKDVETRLLVVDVEDLLVF